jgi:hypothetical protein
MLRHHSAWPPVDCRTMHGNMHGTPVGRAVGRYASCECMRAQEVLKPFLAACGVRAPKLAGIAVMTIQKMLANNLVAEEDLRPIVRALEQVMRAPDMALLSVLAYSHTVHTPSFSM